MTKHLKADGRARGKAAAVAVCALQPALTDIPGALAYLGDVGRSKFYRDLLPQLDVVRFGARTFITIKSLDKLIRVHRQVATEAEQLLAEG
jgi:hypothetical protein